MQTTASSIPLLSFFTGVGLLDLGFRQAGFEIIWHNERELSFARGFQYGMERYLGSRVKEPNILPIEELGPTAIIRDAFGSRLPPNEFGMIGGPPCPDFSVGGQNKGEHGDNGRLSQTYVHRIQELQPTFFLFENVPGLIRTKRHREFINRLWNQLAFDYQMDLHILNALDFGVPQDRQRVIWIGIRRKWLRHRRLRWDSPLMLPSAPNQPTIDSRGNPSPFPTPDPQLANAKSRFEWPTTSEFGSDPLQPHPAIPQELMAGTWLLDDAISDLPNQSEFLHPYSNKIPLIPEGDVRAKSFKRLHRHRYSPTVAYGHNEVHLHPTLPRRLTVREAMRLQSVPDQFALPPDMPLTAKFKTIGNGVPVRLAQAIGTSIRSFLEG